MAVDPSMPVLVVDDYKTMVRIIQNLLKSLGFTNVHGAVTGEEAVAKIAEHDYGLIISDWNMEPMSCAAKRRPSPCPSSWSPPSPRPRTWSPPSGRA
jgi:response regulator RpfG family c-di-GMP phosphodiesterase